jgi:hypothetical protein
MALHAATRRKKTGSAAPQPEERAGQRDGAPGSTLGSIAALEAELQQLRETVQRHNELYHSKAAPEVR